MNKYSQFNPKSLICLTLLNDILIEYLSRNESNDTNNLNVNLKHL